MSPFVSFIIYAIGAFTAVAQVAIMLFIVATLFNPTLKEWLHERLGRHGVLVALTLIGGSIVGSLFLSDIAGFAACFLCWVQRVLMYPQIILFGWYLYKPKRLLLDIALWMTGLGILVAGYQILLENGLAGELVPCEAVLSLTASCATKYINLFGYLTIPVMSFTVFVALLSILIVVLRRKHWLPRRAKELGQP